MLSETDFFFGPYYCECVFQSKAMEDKEMAASEDAGPSVEEAAAAVAPEPSQAAEPEVPAEDTAQPEVRPLLLFVFYYLTSNDFHAGAEIWEHNK